MKLFKEYAKYTCSNVMGMLGLSCYILADTYFVSKGLGSNGLAALNLAIPVFSLIRGIGLMLAMGGATRFSILKCQNAQKQKDQVFSQTALLASCFAVLFVLTGVVGTELLTKLLGANETVYQMCSIYLKVLLLFSPAFLANDVLICFVRNDGAPQLAMTAMLAGSFSNIFLDYVFVFLCQMGIFGAVFATGLAPMISIGILCIYFRPVRTDTQGNVYRKHTFHLVRTRVTLRDTMQIMAGGMPSLAAELSSGIVIIIFNMIMFSLKGNTGIAAYGVVANLSLVVIAMFTGVAQGIQPVVSKYYGAKKTENVKKIFRYAMITVVVLSELIYGGMFAWSESLASIFNSEGDVQLQKIASEGIRLYFTGTIFAGFNIITAIYFTSQDQVKPGNMISLLRGFFLIIPLAFLLSGLFGMKGLWLTFPLTELLTTMTAAFFLKSVNT